MSMGDMMIVGVAIAFVLSPVLAVGLGKFIKQGSGDE